MCIRDSPYTQQAPVTIQSFETGNLRQLRELIGTARPNLRLLQLLGGGKDRPYDLAAARQRTTYGDMMTPCLLYTSSAPAAPHSRAPG